MLSVLCCADLEMIPPPHLARVTIALAAGLDCGSRILRQATHQVRGDFLELRTVQRAQGVCVVLLLTCLKHLVSAAGDGPSSARPSATACSQTNLCPRAAYERVLAQGFAAVRRLVDGHGGGGVGVCRLLEESDDVLFRALLQALHVQQALVARHAAATLTHVAPAAMQTQGEEAEWFRRELAPAAVMDALCSQWGGVGTCVRVL